MSHSKCFTFDIKWKHPHFVFPTNPQTISCPFHIPIGCGHRCNNHRLCLMVYIIMHCLWFQPRHYVNSINLIFKRTLVKAGKSQTEGRQQSVLPNEPFNNTHQNIYTNLWRITMATQPREFSCAHAELCLVIWCTRTLGYNNSFRLSLVPVCIIMWSL